ncbi:MAG: hypothetical protein Alis3KO_16350 [Aliiglaciecola sp.]
MFYYFLRSTLYILTIALVSSIHSHATDTKHIVVGTYAYPSIDREAAVKPLAELVANTFHLPTTIIVANTPSALARMVAQNEVQIAVPNLVGFALIAASKPDIYTLAVPDNTNSTYTSSIVAYQNEDAIYKSLSETITQTTKPIGMVWPDSASGAIVASAYLKEIFNKQQLTELANITYLQSHQNVLDALLKNTVDVGVLATKVFNERHSEYQQSLVEIWRSPPIPYGPVVCKKYLESICSKIKNVLLDKNRNSRAVLEGLKQGWVEFESSTSFVTVEPKIYSAFIEHYAN